MSINIFWSDFCRNSWESIETTSIFILNFLGKTQWKILEQDSTKKSQKKCLLELHFFKESLQEFMENLLNKVIEEFLQQCLEDFQEKSHRKLMYDILIIFLEGFFQICLKKYEILEGISLVKSKEIPGEIFELISKAARGLASRWIIWKCSWKSPEEDPRTIPGRIFERTTRGISRKFMEYMD